MSVKRLTPKGHADAFVDKQMSRKRAAIIELYRMLGEEALTIARTRHKYTRQSGNLTSSIGYCIVDNGKVLEMSSFDVVVNGKKGAEEGRKFLKKLISENSDGIKFIMVAGMNYASYVEAMSLDVLESAEMFFKNKLPKALKAIRI